MFTTLPTKKRYKNYILVSIKLFQCISVIFLPFFSQLEKCGLGVSFNKQNKKTNPKLVNLYKFLVNKQHAYNSLNKASFFAKKISIWIEHKL